jgi:hypothetical protein
MLSGGARAQPPREQTSRTRDPGMTVAALRVDSRRRILTVPLAVRREKHTPIQAVVFQVGTKDSGQGAAGDNEDREGQEAGLGGLPRRKERGSSPLCIMAVGVLRSLVWWTIPLRPRIPHGTYDLPNYTLH